MIRTTTIPRKRCKGCEITVQITQEEIDKLFTDITHIRHLKLVSQGVYEERMAQCLSCRYLEYGTTCLQCGCLVQIKAKLLSAKCSYPYEPKW